METRVLDGQLLARMIKGGAANLYGNRDEVNDLNVFPIPDGDTGDNMYMTIDSGCRAIPEGAGSLGSVGSGAAGGMLMGARGNSGVILSRIAAGICALFEGREDADVSVLADSMKNGVSEAYNAVMTPVEGTILTVYREAVEYMTARINGESTLESCMNDFIQEMRSSLSRTPEQLQCLKDAGVVDSGGAGLLCIAEGMMKVLEGEDPDYSGAPTAGASTEIDISLFGENSQLEYGYCTEFMLRLQTCKVGPIENFDESIIKNHLSEAGESLVFYRSGSLLRVHVHTFKPGEILNYCQQYGEFLTLKIENMTLQHNETVSSEKTAAESRFRIRTRKPYGTVAVASGDGICNTFTELGTDAVIDGGQTSNPSTEDFIKAFDRVGADTVFVFPNNGNVQMAAEQAASMYSASDVRVVPTKDIGQGYAALSVLDTSSGDTSKILSEMSAAICGVKTVEVSAASRDATVGNVEVKKGDYIGFSGKTVLCDDPDRLSAALTAAGKADAGNYDIILLFPGKDAPADEAEQLRTELEKRYRTAEVIMREGGQAVYDYIIILE